MSARGNRREFLADVGRGMLIAAVGSTTAADLGLGPVSAGRGAGAADLRPDRAAGRADAGDARPRSSWA